MAISSRCAQEGRFLHFRSAK